MNTGFNWLILLTEQHQNEFLFNLAFECEDKSYTSDDYLSAEFYSVGNFLLRAFGFDDSREGGAYWYELLKHYENEFDTKS